MRKTFKLLSLVLALSMMLSVCSIISVSAEASLAIGKVEYVIEDDIVTFTVPYTAVDVNQITILATKGDASGAPVESDTNIVYADQQDNASNVFTFKVKMSHFTAQTPYIYIKIGGTSIDTAKSAGGILIEDTVAVLVYGDVDGSTVIDISDVVCMIEYIGTLSVGEELDSEMFPDGTFAGGEESARLTVDEIIDISDVVLLIDYIGTLSIGEELDEIKFPNGKFPRDKQ